MDAKAPPDAPRPETSLETMTPLPAQEMPPPKRTRFAMSPINQRRWKNFKANRRGYWSLWIFLDRSSSSRCSPKFIANDRPLVVSYKGEILFPVFIDYPEAKFGGFFAATDYRSDFIRDEIDANGWMVWPPIRYSAQTENREMPLPAPSPPSWMLAAEERCQRYPLGRRRPRAARSGTGTGSAPTTRAATWWRG